MLIIFYDLIFPRLDPLIVVSFYFSFLSQIAAIFLLLSYKLKYSRSCNNINRNFLSVKEEKIRVNCRLFPLTRIYYHRTVSSPLFSTIFHLSYTHVLSSKDFFFHVFVKRFQIDKKKIFLITCVNILWLEMRKIVYC